MPSNVIQGFFPNGAGRTAPFPASLPPLPRGGGMPLPPVVQRSAESAFHTSFADVRIHVGREAASIGAVAFTNGTNVYFAPGRYDPHHEQGRRVLWHELTHVVQQKSGRVRNPFGAGLAIVHDRLLEAEAERMSHRAATIQPKRRGVLQPLLMYTYPAGIIVHSTYTEEQLESFGKTAVHHMGVTVYTHEDNVADTKREIERRMARGSLSAIPGEDELQVCEEGVCPIQGAELHILKTWNPSTIARGTGVYVPGKVFYRLGQGAFHHLTESMLNRYWDLKYSKFQKLTRPDWRYNCADYALSTDGITSIDHEDTYLGTHFNLVFDLKTKTKEDVQDAFGTAGTYVCRIGSNSYSHYFRIVVAGSVATVSQKDGDSAVYSKTMGLGDAAAYCYERQPSMMRLYRRK
jgi:hypothetical protein